MILHPGILALLLGAVVVLGLQGYACISGVEILRHWDRDSNAERQLELERKTRLVAVLTQYALAFQGGSLLLFVVTAEALHPLFVGAMCATGTLNANPIGWAVLWLKIAGFFLAGLWLVVNHYDQQAEDYPLTRPKYLVLLLLLPLTVADASAQLRFFLGLQPQIITSCCGTLFGAAKGGAASSLAALPTVPTVWGFYLVSLVYLAGLAACLRWSAGWLRNLLALLAAGYFGTVLVAVIAFVSVYIYQRPTHHCPFDLLQGDYGCRGFPLYIAWFGSVFCGLVPAVLLPLRRHPSLRGDLPGRERRWLQAGLLLAGVLLALVSWPLCFGALTLQDLG